MNARDVLREWAEHAETHIGPDCADSRALRELDQLMETAWKLLNMDRIDIQMIEGWRKRAAQAGYGEK